MTVDWVCPECGLDYKSISPRDASGAVRTFPRRYRAVLTAFDNEEGMDTDEIIRQRPSPDVWSALEYTAHVAQVIDLMAPNLRQIITEDNPYIYTFDPEQQLAEQSYNDWPLLRALGELESACADMSMAIEYVGADDWNRVGTFDHGEREAIDVARSAVHEGAHHLRDIKRNLSAIVRRDIDDWL